MKTALDRWQREDGFPSSDYFDAVTDAIAARGIVLADWSREEPWEWTAQIDEESWQTGPLGRYTDLWISWRCSEDDQPAHPDDFTGPGWYWVPYDRSDRGGEDAVFSREFGLPYLAEPDQVAAAVDQLVHEGGDRR